MSWWGSELAGMMPGASQRLSGGADRRYIVSVEANGLCLLDLRTGPALDRSARLMAAVPQPDMLLQLANMARVKAATAIGIRVPFSTCFVRRVEMPAAATSDFPRLLALDFERGTPFKRSDVYLAHYVEKTPAAPGKVWVRQLIIKRASVDGLKADIEGLGLEVGFLDCWDGDNPAGLPVDFFDQAATGKASGGARGALTMTLAALAVVLAALGVYLVIDKHETALQQLQGQTERQKAKAQAAREALAKSQVAYSEIANFNQLRSAAVSKMSVIEELTRLLPDTAWVTDLKIDGATVDISGFAKSAATLVPILERSAMFVDATPTSPLTFDQREDKDRFSIRVHIRKSVTTSAEAPREPAK